MQIPMAVQKTAGLAVWIALSPVALQAQDPAGLEAGATLSFGILGENNDWKAYTGLGFSLSSSTRTQSLGFSASAGLEYPDANDELNLVDPNVLLTYNRIGRNALFQASARYRESDLGGFVIDEDSTVGELVANTGTKNELRLATALEFGTQSLFGGKVDLDWRQVTYSGSATLADYETSRAGITLRFSIDPRIDLRTTLDFQETQADAIGTDRTNQTFGFGADFKVTQTLQTSLDLRYSEFETRPFGSPVQKDKGPSFRFSAVQDLKNGELNFDLSSRVTSNGTRSDASVGRSLKTAQGDEILLSAGVSHGGNGDVDGIFALEYSRGTRDAEFSLALSRSVEADLFGQETLKSQFRIGQNYTINETSSISGALAFRETEFLNSTTPNTRKLELSFGYAQELVRDLDLVAEVSQTRSWSGSTGPTLENKLYMGIERSFSWRP